MSKKFVQIILGIVTSFILNVFVIMHYFYFALGILKGPKKYTLDEYIRFTTHLNLIMIPLSYIAIWGVISLAIFKFFNLKSYSIAFMITGVVMTVLIFLGFPSILWK